MPVLEARFMLPLPASDLVTAIGGDPGQHPGEVTGLAVDSRRVMRGQAFFALQGVRTDGALFLDDARARGAVLCVAGPGATPARDVVIVDDPVKALGLAASALRDHYEGPVVGITGTAGKTTLKEFLRTLLPARLTPVLPEASFNNRIGVPLTIGALEPGSGVLVLELGTSARGEIGHLAAIARPTIGVITSVGPGHLEGLGSVEGVLDEKLDLARALPGGSLLVLNGEDPVLASAHLPPGLDVRRLGLAPAPGIVAPASVESGRLVSREGEPAIVHPFTSRVRILDLWMALEVARALGVTPDELAEGARDLAAPRMRGELTHRGSTRVIVDCYNANPLSMRAALGDLALEPGPRGAVLGEMLELGSEADHHHAELGANLARLELDRVIFVGPSGELVIRAAKLAGMDPTRIVAAESVDAARPGFSDMLAAGGTVLLKASRRVALERLLEEPTDG